MMRRMSRSVVVMTSLGMMMTLSKFVSHPMAQSATHLHRHHISPQPSPSPLPSFSYSSETEHNQHHRHQHNHKHLNQQSLDRSHHGTEGKNPSSSTHHQHNYVHRSHSSSTVAHHQDAADKVAENIASVHNSGSSSSSSSNSNAAAEEADDDYEPCQLIGGSFAIIIQLLLGIVVLSALFLKRYWDICACRFKPPERDFKTWALDVSKQAIGSCFAHGCNLVLAILLSGIALQNPGEHPMHPDECAWYFINYLADSFLGIPLSWALLEVVQMIAIRCNIEGLHESGNYEGENM